MFAKATPLLSQTQNQEQSHCRNRHGSRCEPAQGVGRRACTEGTLTQAPLSGHLLHPEMLKNRPIPRTAWCASTLHKHRSNKYKSKQQNQLFSYSIVVTAGNR